MKRGGKEAGGGEMGREKDGEKIDGMRERGRAKDGENDGEREKIEREKTMEREREIFIYIQYSNNTIYSIKPFSMN